MKWLNGSGLKLTYIFSSSIKNDSRWWPILKFTETPIINESIEEYEYHEYDPITGTNLNNGGDILISTESQNVFTHPSESYLVFEGRLTKADGTADVNAGDFALTNMR